MDHLISLVRRRGWYGDRKVVAFALRGGRILSIGHNSFNSSSKLQRRYAKLSGFSKRCYTHAEAAVLRHVWGKGVDIVVIRLNAQGMPVMAKPCPVCQRMLKDSGVKNVEWTS